MTAAAWLVLRDLRKGLEHLRNCHEIHVRGLELDLRAYQSHVFLDPAVVWDDPAGDLGRLAWRVGLVGVAGRPGGATRTSSWSLPGWPSTPCSRPGRAGCGGGGPRVRGCQRTRLIDAAVASLSQPLEAIARAIGATSGRGVSVDTVRSAVAARLTDLASAVRAGRLVTRGTSSADDTAQLADWVGTDRAHWATLVNWALSACLGDLVGAPRHRVPWWACSMPGLRVRPSAEWSVSWACRRMSARVSRPWCARCRQCRSGHSRAVMLTPRSARGSRPRPCELQRAGTSGRLPSSWSRSRSRTGSRYCGRDGCCCSAASTGLLADRAGPWNDFRVDVERPSVPEGRMPTSRRGLTRRPWGRLGPRGWHRPSSVPTTRGVVIGRRGTWRASSIRSIGAGRCRFGDLARILVVGAPCTAGIGRRCSRSMSGTSFAALHRWDSSAAPTSMLGWPATYRRAHRHDRARPVFVQNNVLAAYRARGYNVVAAAI